MSAFSQALLKSAADVEYKSFISEYVNIKVVSAYAIMLLCTIFAVIAYKRISVGLGLVLENLSYFYISIIGVFCFKEKIGLKKIIAITIIVLGVIIYAV